MLINSKPLCSEPYTVSGEVSVFDCSRAITTKGIPTMEFVKKRLYSCQNYIKNLFKPFLLPSNIKFCAHTSSFFTDVALLCLRKMISFGH